MKRDFYWSKANKSHLPGKIFFFYGKALGVQLLKKMNFSKIKQAIHRLYI